MAEGDVRSSAAPRCGGGRVVDDAEGSLDGEGGLSSVAHCEADARRSSSGDGDRRVGRRLGDELEPDDDAGVDVEAVVAGGGCLARNQ